MATMIHRIEKALHLNPLLDIHNPIFAEQYQCGIFWYLFEQHDVRSLLVDTDVIDTLKNLIVSGICDGQHEATLQTRLGFYCGIIHAGILSPNGTCRLDVSTLVLLTNQDVKCGYRAAREDLFLEAPLHERRTNDSHLLAWIHNIAKEYPHCWQHDLEATFHFAVGGLLGLLSGSIFPWTREEHDAWEQECERLLGYVCSTPYPPDGLVFSER